MKELEADGLVSKTTFAEVPPRVIYALTEKGVYLIPLVETIRNYGIELLKESGVDYDKLIREEQKTGK